VWRGGDVVGGSGGVAAMMVAAVGYDDLGGGWWVWRGGVDGGCRGVWWPEHGRTALEFGRKKNVTSPK
ncbi:hypothetical protein Tco_0067496, partial [Tanacetum coccineum]